MSTGNQRTLIDAKFLRLGNEIKMIGITTSDKALTTKLLEGDPEAETSRAERDRELLFRPWKPIAVLDGGRNAGAKEAMRAVAFGATR